jgi:Ca2+-binding RTX toxin-like protein
LFYSESDNLVQGDNNQGPDLFIYDRFQEKIERIPVGAVATHASDLSGDGSIIVYVTGESLTSNDKNIFSDLYKIDNPLFEAGQPRLVGTRSGDTIRGKEANDIVVGLEGSDRLFGGDGDDRVIGGPGTDRLFGGDDDDRLAGGTGNDLIYGEGDNDVLWGDGGDDFLRGDEGDDFAFGGMGNDTLIGSEGNDRLQGQGGNDFHSGGDGNDIIRGGAGSETLRGDDGLDRMSGGRGHDRFEFNAFDDSTDYVFDFQDGDKLSVFATPLTRWGLAFRAFDNGRHTFIDVDDDGTSEIVLLGFTGLSAMDIA